MSLAGTPSEALEHLGALSQLLVSGLGIKSRNSAKNNRFDSTIFKAGTDAMSCMLHAHITPRDSTVSIGTGGIMPVSQPFHPLSFFGERCEVLAA
jgi:hypothetical protein